MFCKPYLFIKIINFALACMDDILLYPKELRLVAFIECGKLNFCEPQYKTRLHYLFTLQIYK